MTFNITAQANLGVANVQIQYDGQKRLKLRIMCGKKSIYYDPVSNMVIPLTFGNGTYSFRLYENTAGNSYKLIASRSRSIHMKDVNAYKLNANYFVNFDEASSFFQIAKKLRDWTAIKNYISNNFRYDYIKALTAPKSKNLVPPDLEKVFSEKSGICDGLAALTVAFARICGISATLVMGKADRNAHAWVKVGDELFDPTYAIQRRRTKIKYVEEREY